MISRAAEIASTVLDSQIIQVITHIDADGISAGAIAAAACKRAGKEVDVEFIKQLDADYVNNLIDNHTPGVLYWFTDLGAAYEKELCEIDAIITDHHELKKEMVEVDVGKRTDLMAFSEAVDEATGECLYHLNPHLEGIDGSTSISGAGLAYLVAREMDQNNKDLALLAIVGAVGDFQSSDKGRLEGLNRDILADAIDTGLMRVDIDLCLFGRETRPVFQYLMYATEPAIPTLARDELATRRFLKDLDIPISFEDRADHIRKWVDLTSDEKRKVVSGIAELFMVSGGKKSEIQKVVGENYILVSEEKGTALHDAKEYSTLLNSCGRYGHARAGLEVCMGDRGEWLDKAKDHMKDHRKNLSQYIRVVQGRGLTQMDNIQWVYVESEVPEEVIGILAGMVLGSGDTDRSKPIIAIADSEDGGVKASARGDREQVDKGLDLSKVMKEACELVGGAGGGHNIAAGGQVPTEKMQEFLAKVDEMVGRMTE